MFFEHPVTVFHHLTPSYQIEQIELNVSVASMKRSKDCKQPKG